MLLHKTIVFLLCPIFRLLYRIKVTGRENMPSGAAVVCCNHTSWIDPVLLSLGLGPKVQLCYMGKKEVFKNPILNKIFRAVGAFPVDRENVELATIRHSIELLKEGKKLGIFPEGRRVREGEEENAATGAKTGVAMIAMRANVPIIPVFLTRRKRILHRHHLIVGKPIIPEKKEGSTSENYQRIAQEAFQAILDLGDRT